MKLKYVISNGEIKNFGTGDWVAEEGQNIVEVEFGFPSEPISYFTYNAQTGQLDRKPQEVIDEMVALQDFNVNLMSIGFAKQFDIATQSKLKSSFAVIEGYASARAFKGEKSVRSFLVYEVDHDEMSSEEYEVIRQVILAQGIDIGAL